MNRFAYRMTGLAIKAIADLSKANIHIRGADHIPYGSLLFVINHFTRIETLLMPYQIFKLTHTPVWSLASYQLFQGPLGSFLNRVGAVSTKDPDRDRLIVKSLLTGEASWIIFPEGRMVKNKKIIEKGRFMISYAGGKHPPHTGAATLALRTEFYRQRIKHLLTHAPKEADRLLERFKIETIAPVLHRQTHIVPVNITYFPIRVQQNILSHLATKWIDDIPDRIIEEIMTEGTMLLSGVDVHIRFGKPITVTECLTCPPINRDVTSPDDIEFDMELPSKRFMRKEALNMMEQYMQAIYGLTTVNHDHLFASMLRVLPRKQIDIDDLCRRIYWVIHQIKNETGVHKHPSLNEDQTHLLTDDRYHRVADFLAIAIEKGVVKREGNRLHIDRHKFSSPWDFHRIRIDNPIEVMANAVEPLKLLQRKLRRIAWTPGFLMRRRMRRLLKLKALTEFNTDYRVFFAEGESKAKYVGRPFLLKGKHRKAGVVLIHGYLAAPLEMKELASYLNQQGYWVYVVRVKGHGTSPQDLAQRTYHDWRISVDHGFAVMKSVTQKVVIGGFSNGAGLALDLATRIKAVDGIFVICPPLQLQDISSKLVPAVDVWNRLMKKVRLTEIRMEFVDNHPEHPQINYLRNPIAGVRELERLMDTVEPKLADIRVPALVVQADGDPVVNPKGSQKVFERLGSIDKQYVTVNFDRHGITMGERSDEVHRIIAEFMRKF